MTLRFTLSKAGIKNLESKQKKVFGGTEEVKILQGYTVEVTDTGSSYVTLYLDPNNPSAESPNLNPDYFERVTFKGEYESGFRLEGIYNLKGAVARVETQTNVINRYGGGEARIRRVQNIDISARAVEEIKEIYSAIRSGKLKPAEDWESAEMPVQEIDSGN